MPNDSKNKFQRGMVYLFAILASIGIAPFIVIRYVNREPINALVDLAIVLTALGSALVTYRRGQATPGVSIVTAALYSAGAVAVAYLNNPILVFWLFPAILANFFLLSANAALAANLLSIAAIVPIALRLDKDTDSFAMLSALLICGSMAYTFARLTEQQRALLQGYATQDALTQLGNRRAMNAELELCIQDYERAQIPATLILLDFDFFKAVNDKHGHTAGDKVLVELADLLVRRVRKTDRLFRFGGEEFVVIARNTLLADGLLIAAELRGQIAAHIYTPAGQPMTASFGCAQLYHNESAEDWFIRADKAVYQAKQNGRNCVVAAD